MIKLFRRKGRGSEKKLPESPKILIVREPGNYQQILERMQSELGYKLPENFPMILGTLALNYNRNELILPENPTAEASYFLAFPKGETLLEYSFLTRIKGNPQPFSTLEAHENYEIIIKELRRLYDNKTVKPVAKTLLVPVFKPLEKRFKEEELDFDIILPSEIQNIAGEFEKIFARNDAIKTLERRVSEPYRSIVSADGLARAVAAQDHMGEGRK